MKPATEKLTIYLPTSVSLLAPTGRALIDRILSHDKSSVSYNVELVSDERWLAMMKGR